jgi:hypothetical protein
LARAAKKLGCRRVDLYIGKMTEEDVTLEAMAGIAYDEKLDMGFHFIGYTAALREELTDYVVPPKVPKKQL